MTVNDVDHVRQGKSNRSRGSRGEKSALEFIRRVFPGAARTRLGEPGGDITGIGDRNIEVTTAAWSEIARKCDQSERAAMLAGVREWGVLKPRIRSFGRWYWIADGELTLRLLRELDELRAREWAEQDEYDKGYNAGYQAGLKAGGARNE